MKISDLINELEKTKETFGDLEVNVERPEPEFEILPAGFYVTHQAQNETDENVIVMEVVFASVKDIEAMGVDE